MSFGKKEAERGISEAGRLTAEEQSAAQRAERIDALIEEYLSGRVGAGTPEQQFAAGGPLSKALMGEVTRGVQDPYGMYTSTLDPQLQVAQDFINRRFQERGLLRSGLPIESMGRAGVELAIGEAEKRLTFRGQELERGRLLQQGATNLQQLRLQQLSGVAGRGQQFAAPGIAREAQYQAYPYQAQLGSAYGREAAMYALPGQIIGAIGQLGGGASGDPAYQYGQGQQSQFAQAGRTSQLSDINKYYPYQ